MLREKIVNIELKEVAPELKSNSIRFKDNMVAGIDICNLLGYERNSAIYTWVREEDREVKTFKTTNTRNLLFINRRGLQNLIDNTDKAKNYHRDYINKYVMPELEGEAKEPVKANTEGPVKELKRRLASLEREKAKKQLELEALRKRIRDKDIEVNKTQGEIYKLKKVIYYLEEEVQC